jgi:hypothetical protein
VAFDLNPQTGNIDSLPLFTWDTAVVADAVCLLRLVFARREDEPETDALIVQTTLSVRQTTELVGDLQKLLAHIRTAQQQPRH